MKFPEEWILEKFMDKNWLSLKNHLMLLHNPKKLLSKRKIENLKEKTCLR